MEEQRRRKEREQKDADTDWWEKKKAPETEFKAPHPNQVESLNLNNSPMLPNNLTKSKETKERVNN